MSTYVMSDIHGCYDEFMKMLEKIKFSDKDTLIIAGDYVDRGFQTDKVLDWLLDRPENVIPIKGNHDVEFVEYIRMMEQLNDAESMGTDYDSAEDTGVLYATMNYAIRRISRRSEAYFDYYGTLINLIMNGTTMHQFKTWATMLDSLPYLYTTNMHDREVIVVHAGYIESQNLKRSGFRKKEDFYLWAREEAHTVGGKDNAIIVAGHTPTIVEGRFFNDGHIYKHYDESRNCTFYDIDCGAVFCGYEKNAHMACLRLDDFEEFYLS